ncbi:MAG: DUF1800 family protein [Devosia sp.]
MTEDTNLFAARRLGFGLRLGEDLPVSPRDWAMEQIRAIPKLDFYDVGGQPLASLPADAALTDYAQSCLRFGEENSAEEDILKTHGDDEDFWKVFAKYWEIPHWGVAMAATLSAINGPGPVFERFWQFWCNHFTASTSTGHGKTLIGAHVQTIRAAMTGSFETMLQDAVVNPATIYYLDAVYSAGPHSRAGKTFSLNENLGRELLELYSVSPAAGYTQADVVETALMLTGWAFTSGPKHKSSAVYFPGAQPGRVFFKDYHEPGKRVVMGKTYAADDKKGGQIFALIKDLASHPSTAKFIATKLAIAFIADQPPQESVDRIAAAFTASNGDLVTIHSAVIDEVLSVGPNFTKFTKPSAWLQQAHRTLGTMPTIQPPSAQHLSNGLSALYKDLGEVFGGPPQPNGWPDTEADWLSQANLDRRMRHANAISSSLKPTVADDLTKYVERLAGAGSPLAVACANSGVVHDIAVMMLVSPQFLRT